MTFQYPHLTNDAEFDYNRISDVINQLQDLHRELNSKLGEPSNRIPVDHPRVVGEVLIPFLGGLDHEEFWVVLLDHRYRIMKLVDLYKGTVHGAPLRYAEIFRDAVIHNCSAIIVAHNHPSGKCYPSDGDLRATSEILKAGRVLEIKVIDHVIVAGDQFYSMAEHGHYFDK
jgi:DNA repair protein RadC